MRNFAEEFITEINNLKHYNLMKTTLLSLKAFFTICLLCLVGGVSASAQNATLPFEYQEGKVNIDKTNGLSQKGLGTDYKKVVTKLRFDTSGDVLTLSFDGAADKVSYVIKYNGSDGKDLDGTFSVQYSINGTDWIDIKTYSQAKNSLKSGQVLNEEESVPAKAQYLRWIYSEKKSGNFGLGGIKVTAKTGTFTITPAQYGTYYTEDAFVMPEGVTGYTITSEDGKTLKFNEAYVAGAVVPAKTALVLKATEELTADKEYTYTIVNSTAVAPTDNLLHGSVENATTNVDGAHAYYKLASDPVEGLGFYYGAEDGGAFTNGAHKAYLAVMTKTMSQMRGFSFDSMTTGINHVVANAEHAKSTVIYDLNGRRVNSLSAAAKGVYIVNGKKVIVK
jgi:hypothetical protein